jgi:hypothetical protein
MARGLIDKIIYSITRKPKHYVEVKNPPQKHSRKKKRRQTTILIHMVIFAHEEATIHI